jgi:hypothetical protein
MRQRPVTINHDCFVYYYPTLLDRGNRVTTLRICPTSDGIFEYMTDRIAFIDRVDLSVWGRRRQKPKASISILEGFSIGGPGRIYAYSAHGICHATRNRFEHRYGVLRWPRTVPPSRLILYSNGTPLSYAHVEWVLDGLMRRGCRTCLSRVELTFDVSEPSVEFFSKHAVTAARKVMSLANDRGNSFYAGTRRSAWQLVIYDKAPVVRCEFILRRQFLRVIGIDRPHQLVRLRTLDLRRLVRIQEVDPERLALINHHSGYVQRVIRSWGERLSSRDFLRALRACGRRPDEWLRPCAVEGKLRRMQRRLVW